MSRNTWIVLALLGVLAPFVIYPVFAMEMLCFALFAAAFNLLLGYGGLLSFGHAAFFGSGAYLCGVAARDWGLTPELSILLGGVAGLVLGLAFGLVAIRRQGIYFAMVTLALAQIVFFVALKTPVTGGEDGLQGIPQGKVFGLIDLATTYEVAGQSLPLNLYYFVFAVFAACLWLIYRTVNSPYGQVMAAVRENEPRALSLGYRVDRYKLGLFVMSAGLAGVAGATKAIVMQLASLTDVSWQMSGEVVLMTLLGGMGTITGPVLGAAIVRWLHNQLAALGATSADLSPLLKIFLSVNVVIGLIFIASVLLFRRGIVGELGRLFKRSF
ncbi:branched-chain amino acid ABC transporter permease [Chitinivorax sp. PXF-14]|uniref:branched-chain amino acid ABC transporter permease n=1 Tax=Chitinivorax sp. PXF-14 TaxID=3230488 RepID=UPI003467D671